MDIVKRNLVSIICGAVALLAVILAFFPMGGYFTDLQSRLSQSDKDGAELKRVAGQKVNLPVDPLTGETRPLDQFPTAKATAVGKAAVEQIKTQTTAMMKQAMALNIHPPLVPNVLPTPPQGSRGMALQGFKQAYYPAMAKLKEQLNAMGPLTATEVEAEKKRIFEEVYMTQVSKDAAGKPINLQEKTAEFNAAVLNLAETMRAERSSKITVYLKDDKKSLDYHGGIPELEAQGFPALEDVWAAQLSLWIQQDVVDAIVKTNTTLGKKNPATGKVNVEGAVVKRIVAIEIPKKYIFKGKVIVPFGNNAPGGAGVGMNYASPRAASTAGDPLDDTSPAAALNKDFVISHTGRTSNAVYDVMHFRLLMDVDTRTFQAFMANLTQNRFITILNTQVQGLDRAKAMEEGFALGSEPVATLLLDCEAVFFREWTVYNPETKVQGPMPMEIRKLLRIPEPTAQ